MTTHTFPWNHDPGGSPTDPSQPSLFTRLQDLDQSRSEDGGVGDGDDISEAGTVGESGDGKSKHQVLLEGEVGGEVNSAVAGAGDGDLLNDRNVLLVDVH